MRLLNVHSLELEEFRVKFPSYVIASHRWLDDDEEVSFEEIRRTSGVDRTKRGYQKLQGFANYVQLRIPGIDWLWIDTCCINKQSDAELSESINSMYAWYGNAEVCLAYLSDVASVDDLDSFKHSDWFRRGWTLQELLAPRTVVFLTKSWEVLGYKGPTGRCKSGIELDCGSCLTSSIISVTRIPGTVLNDVTKSKNFTIDGRLEWGDKRNTTREEDLSYSLIGLFDVSMSVIYGEGKKKARHRLLEEIQKTIGGLSRHEFNQFNKIVEWLSAPDPWIDYGLALRHHEPGTGLWLLESRSYQLWKRGEIAHLWLSGKAGCGKSILCSTVIEDVQKYCASVDHAEFAFFYFSFDHNRKQSYEDLLLSLTAQLGYIGPGALMLQQAYEKPGQKVPGAHELEQVLLQSMQSSRQVFLLLDALDECPDSQTANLRSNVLRYLQRLVQQVSQVKIFVTSRDTPDIEAAMQLIEVTRMNTTTRSVNEDISKYVSVEMARDARLNRFSPDMKVLVKRTLSEKADGMFRWAFCQLEELKKLRSTKPSHVRAILQALPLSLDETYERMLAGIEEQYREEALTLLQWIAYARSPLSLQELAEVTIIDLDRDIVITEDRGSPEDALDILSGLITLDNLHGHHLGQDDEDTASRSSSDMMYDGSEEDGDLGSNDSQRGLSIRGPARVKLAHYSVKAFLESFRITQSKLNYFYLDEGKSHRFIAQSCLVYIMHYSLSPGKKDGLELLNTFPMLNYAASSWYYHSKHSTPGTLPRELALLRSKRMKYDWLYVHDPERDWRDLEKNWQDQFSFEAPQEVASALYFASYLGLETVLNELLESDPDINLVQGSKGPALQAAMISGHQQIARILIARGANINVQGGHFGTALQAAAWNGDTENVKMLIENGADVNLQGGKHDNALQAAILKGHDDVVRILITNHADVNARLFPFGNILQDAAYHGNLAIVKLLIEHGVEVNTYKGENVNALQAAAYKGHEGIVRLLIEHGADVNLPGGKYGDALQAALEAGNEKIVEILIANRVNIQANALQRACAIGNQKIVRMLLQSSDRVNAGGGTLGNALQVASRSGHEAIVKMLIERGAHINESGGPYGTALQAASRSGKDNIVKMLLASGADVNATGGPYGSALKAATQFGNVEIVRLLRQRGADIRKGGDPSGNAFKGSTRIKLSSARRNSLFAATKYGRETYDHYNEHDDERGDGEGKEKMGFARSLTLEVPL